MVEIICPACNKEGTLVSVECVYQTFGVFYTKEGALDFDGNVISSWGGEYYGIECSDCGAEFTHAHIKETDQAKELQANAEKEE